MCDSLSRAECVPTFDCESERGAFVSEVEKQDEKRSGTALVTAVLLDFPPLLDDGGSQRTGKCMYIKARRNQGLQMEAFRAISLIAQSRAVAKGWKTPVSACEPLCAILCAKASVYSLSLVKANVGRLCEKLKSGIRSGLKQRCGGNFLAIVAGTILSEKLNFTGGFFEWRRPFDFSTR